ncbi:MAG: response regulator [Deltaproteobacteria bacterium]|nr:MAG: response regulator [Deltaproteobacteria bacterium]
MTTPGSILLVDDSELALELTKVVLEDAGYAVKTALSGEEALDAIDRSPPDVVVCDLHMSDMSGLEFVGDPLVATSGIPVIVQSSDDNVSAVLDAVRQGVFEYVIKSADLEPLIAAVRRACAHRRVVVENRSLRASMQERLSEAQQARDALEQEVAERRRAERELAEAHRRASEASSAKSRFLASMSHELRTPLNAIIGYSELVREELHDIDVHDADADLARILGASRHLLSLVNEILDLSRIESGRLETNIEPVAVRSLVDDVSTTVTPLAAKHGNRFVLEAGDHLGVVFTDAGRVRQILLNLLGNAFKFTESGEVRLVARRDEGVNPRLVLQVSDTGIGMTEAQCARIFQPFVQAEASTASRFGGSGLGLAISQQLCRLLGGDLAVSSTPGEGSTFTATFPVVPGALAPAGKAWRIDRLLAVIEPGAPATRDPESWEELPAEGAEARAISRERRVSAAEPGTGLQLPHVRGEVFVVEDDPVVRVILERGLNHKRCRVRAFGDGESFLAELEVSTAGVVILDLNLPGIDGFSLVDRLQERFPDVPIIVLTGQNLDRVQIPFLARRCAAVLTKHHTLESGAVTAIRLAVELIDPE